MRIGNKLITGRPSAWLVDVLWESRAGCHFSAAIGLRSILEGYAPEVPDWALDQHTLAGRKLGRGLDHFRQEGARLVPPPTGDDPDIKLIGCGRSSSGASKFDGYRLSPYHSTFLQYPSPQRYCHAIPTAASSLPVRVVMPVLAESLREFCRLIGKATVKPARVIACSLSLLTPLRVVRPPAR